jgi:YtkA-like
MKTPLMLPSAIALALLITACGSKEGTTAGRVIKSAPAGNNLTVSLSTGDGVLKRGNTEFTLSFTDTAGKTVDVGAVALIFHMPQMGTMAEMNDAATLTTTETPGVYRGTAKVQMGGEWQVRITYEGQQGRGQASFPVTVQ